MRFFQAVAIAALSWIALLGATLAQDATLTSRDGTITLNGTLLGYDGEYYRIETEYGILTVDGSSVQCDGPGCPNLGNYVAQLTFSGAPEISAVLIPALIEGFALRRGYALARSENPGQGLSFTLYEGGEGGNEAARITVLQTSSAEGFADLLGQGADFALSLREVRPQEARLAREAGLGNLTSARQARVLALDAMVPVVSRDNPVRRLTLSQLADIYAGKVTNWADLGGEDAPITAYLPAPGQGFSDLFEQRILGRMGLSLSPQVRRKPGNHSLVHAVARDPFGIGIAVYSQPGETEIVRLAGTCGFEVTPSPLTIKAEDYPLTAPLYLYIPGRRLPKVGREFLTYLRSSAAQFVIRRAGLVDQLPQEIAIDDQGRRLANAILAAGDEVDLPTLQAMIREMTDRRRLSVTFRFRDGSSTLDAQSLSNIGLLASAIEAGQFDARDLALVGFTDGQGGAQTNLKLAERRANVVARALREAAQSLDAGQIDLSVAAFGEALPMACDDTAWGRQVNRRVEVWLR